MYLTILKMFGPYIAVGLAAAFVTWKVMDWRYDAREAELLNEAIEMRDKMEGLHRQLEAGVVERAGDREVIVNEVIREIPVYIDRDTCSLNPDGLSSLNKIRRDNTQREPAG